jgi:hypothetical protein
MMSGPDIYGYDPVYHSPDEGIWYGDTPNWWDLASQGIDQAAQTAQIIGAGYPPGSNVSIQYPQQQPALAVMPQLYPQTTPTVTAQPKTGVLNLSTNELLILGLIGFAFIFGKRGR